MSVSKYIPRINRVIIENFKAFRERQEFKLAPITLLYGPNSAGKSSIIQALAYAYHISRTKDFDPQFLDIGGSRISVGGYENLVYNHDPNRNITLGFEVDHTEFNSTIMLSDVQITSSTHIVTFDSKCCKEYELQLNGVFFLRMKTETYEYTKDDITKVPEISLIKQTSSMKITEFNHNHPVAINAWITLCKSACESACKSNSNLGKEVQVRSEEKFNEFLQKEWIIKNPPSEMLDEYLLQYIFSPHQFPPSCNNIDLTVLHDINKREQEFEDLTQEMITNEDDSTVRVSGDIGAMFAKRASVFIMHVVDDAINALSRQENKGGVESALTLIHLGPHRYVPERNWIIKNAHSSGNMIEFMAEGWALESDALNFVNSWLNSQNRLDTNYEIREREFIEHQPESTKHSAPSKRVSSIYLYDLNRNIEVAFSDVGSGISQILPVLLASSMASDDIILIEQPELHLHPALQAELADLFIMCSRRNSEDISNEDLMADAGIFIIETHSEHLLLRLMRRIRETRNKTLPEDMPPITKNEVCVLYIENLGTRSIVREMPLNNYGELVRDWPGGFFEEGLREVLI
ncbi:MAG: hypothetical protein EOM12_12940 [Verrucomicrobiae bacterium]|nr:hypothetical protein [Verrucomicrobiae bacterium]